MLSDPSGSDPTSPSHPSSCDLLESFRWVCCLQGNSLELCCLVTVSGLRGAGFAFTCRVYHPLSTFSGFSRGSFLHVGGEWILLASSCSRVNLRACARVTKPSDTLLTSQLSLPLKRLPMALSTLCSVFNLSIQQGPLEPQREDSEASERKVKTDSRMLISRESVPSFQG